MIGRAHRTGVADGDLLGRGGGERRRLRRRRVPGQRRADVPDLPGADADGQHAVDRGDQVAEALPEQHDGALAQRGDGHQLQGVGAAGGQPEHLAVGVDVGAGGGDRVGRQPAGQRPGGCGQRRRCAQGVPPRPGAGGRGPLALLRCRCGATHTVVLDLGVGAVAGDGHRDGRCRPRCGRGGPAAGTCGEDERAGDECRRGARERTGWCAHECLPCQRLCRSLIGTSIDVSANTGRTFKNAPISMRVRMIRGSGRGRDCLDSCRDGYLNEEERCRPTSGSVVA